MMHYRYDYLTEIINEKGYKDIAEIGLNNCETLNCLMEKCPTIESYVGIDKIVNAAIEDSVKKYDAKFHFIKGDSTDIGNGMNKMFDLVFVDADHSYEKVLFDLRAWENKVRDGGIFCGDDYGNPHWPGVKAAVDYTFSNKERVINAVGHPVYVWWILK